MLHQIPSWFQVLFPGYIWRMNPKEKEIYLTFDDGPLPEITEWVLTVLKNVGIKATFFVVGENVLKHSKIFKKIIKDEHSIGNHTYHHVKGWGASTQSYIKDVNRCSHIIKEYSGVLPTLFRPPHGRIWPAQAKLLRKEYRLVMWNTLTIDYDRALHEKKCLKSSIDATRPGSIVVFHDSAKAEKNLKYVLPKYIDHFLCQGYSFKKL